MNLAQAFQAKLGEAEAIRQAHATNPGGMPAEQATKWGSLIEEAEALKAQLGIEARANSLKSWGAEAQPMLALTGAQQQQYGAGTLQGFTPAGEDEGVITEPQFKAIKTREYKAAFRQYLKVGINGLKSDEYKTLSEGTDSAGGFLVPEEMIQRIIQKAPTPTRVNGRVTRLQTSRDSLVMPKVNYTTDDIYTTGIRVTWTGEVPSSSTVHRVTDPVFGQTRIPIFTAMLSMPLTNDMVEDAMFPIIPFVTGKFQETVDILYDDKTLNGTGLGQPSGILLNPNGTDQPATVNSGGASTLTADGLSSLAFAVPEQYDEMSTFVMNKTSTAKAIAQLKDSQNRYLWGAGLQDSGLVPSLKNRTLLGYDVTLSGLMPNVAANAYPIIFGDLGGYALVNRVGFSVQVLRELYAETNQILLLGRLRFGGATIEPWKLKIQKVAS